MLDVSFHFIFCILLFSKRKINSTKIHWQCLFPANIVEYYCLLTWFRTSFDWHWVRHVDGFAFEQFILLPQMKATKAHNFLEIMTKPSIHPVVNNRINHTVWHGQPIKCQKQMWNIIRWCNMWPMIRVHVE